MVEWNWNAPTAVTPSGSRSSRTNDGHRAIPTRPAPVATPASRPTVATQLAISAVNFVDFVNV